MNSSIFFSFVLYAFVTSATPGPNNIMVTASGLNFGFLKSIPHILGIGFGFGAMVAMVGLGIGSLLSNSIYLYQGLKIIGILYLLYLAYKIAFSGKIEVKGNPHKPLSFFGAVLFQWVNPKAWMMTIGAITTYTSPHSHTLLFLFIGLIYGLVCIPNVAAWAYLGNKLSKIITHDKYVNIFNIMMALLLVISVLEPIGDSLALLYN